MKVVALVSGGKDSCYAMHLAQQHGHEVVALANLLPASDQPDDLNSYMYQTVGYQLVEAYATCTGLPLYRKYIQGTSARQDLQYTRTEGDEVEDLYCLLSYIKESIPSVTAVTSGAIASDYQRLRVEHVCARLNLVSLSYLWHQPQRQLLRGMIESGIHAVLVKVAALGLSPNKHLGRSIAQLEHHLLQLNTLYGSHVCGEGGEYETLTLDSPLFTHARIVLDASEVVIETDDSMAPVAYLHPTEFHVEPKVKSPPPTSPGPSRTQGVSASQGPGVEQLVSGQANGTGMPAALPRGSVHVVPALYTPMRESVPRELSRSSVCDHRQTSSKVHVRLRQQEDYVQATCWATQDDHQALSSEITEHDTACALLSILTGLQAQLHDLGLHMGHALYVHMLLGNMGHFGAANSVYCKVLPSADPPSRTCVQLTLPAGVPVVLDMLLAKNASSGPAPPPAYSSTPSTPPAPLPSTPPANAADGTAGVDALTAALDAARAAGSYVKGADEKKVLHVQSISCWAPSCIGPYSQATAYRGLIHLAGTIPLNPASMTVLQGGIVEQTQCALTHVQSIAVALRTCALRASLCLVVYYCESIGKAGKDQVRQIVESTLDKGSIGAPIKARSRPWAPSTYSDLGPLSVQPDSNGQQGQDDDQHEDEEEDAEDELQLDDYLKPPPMRRSVRGNVVYVAVPALPRGCLVEVQALLLDLSWLERRASFRSDTTDDSTAGGLNGHTNSHAKEDCGCEDEPLVTSPSTSRLPPEETDSKAAAEARHANGAPANGGDTALGNGLCADVETADGGEEGGCDCKADAKCQQGELSLRRRSCSLPAEQVSTELLDAEEHPASAQNGSSCNGHGLRRMRTSRSMPHHQHALTYNSCHTSICGTLDDAILLPTGSDPGTASGSQQLSADGDLSQPGLNGQDCRSPRESGGQQAAAGNDVMVTSVNCQQHGLLKSLYHLPADVFSRPAPNARLQRAVHGVLAGCGLSGSDVVSLRAWYDTKQLPSDVGSQLLGEQVDNWQISWMPCSHVSTSACAEGMAAVLEVVARKPTDLQ